MIASAENCTCRVTDRQSIVVQPNDPRQHDHIGLSGFQGFCRSFWAGAARKSRIATRITGFTLILAVAAREADGGLPQEMRVRVDTVDTAR